MPLNPKQAAFVREYLKDHNATQAAIRVGYSEKTAYAQGCRLLKHAEVCEALAKHTEKAGITAQEVLEGLRHEAKNADQSSARVAAWSWLGKHHKLFTDKQELSGPDGERLTVKVVTYGGDE